MTNASNPSTPEPGFAPRRRPRRWRRILLAVAVLLLAGPALFIINGALMGYGQTPLLVTTAHPAAPPLETHPPLTLRVFEFNIAKCFAPQGGLKFDSQEAVATRIRRIADLIRFEDPDLVFLSETMIECGPCPVNQVSSLAEAAGMHAWVFGENYNFGLPFYRAIGGNAILSRRPLEAVANSSLAGRRPFYITKNNRRLLWCAMQINGRRLLLASVHNDSFDLGNNLRQTRQLLDFAAGQDALIAGDFNARPSEPPMQLIQNSGRFTGAIDGPFTFPSDKPEQRIDYILAPSSWELIEQHVIESEVSDHRPVVSTFRIK